jgi:hypothetical protein
MCKTAQKRVNAGARLLFPCDIWQLVTAPVEGSVQSNCRSNLFTDEKKAVAAQVHA